MRQKLSRWAFIVPVAGAVLVVLTGLLIGCSRQPEGEGKPAGDAAVPVLLSPVKVQPVQRRIEVVGTLWGDEDAMIATKVAGKVVEIHKDVGDTVAAGEPLAQIDKTDYALQARQKELAVKESLAKVGLGELPQSGFDPSHVPTVERARVRTDNAQSKFNRGQELFGQQPPRISAQEFEDLKTDLAVAARDYDVEVMTAQSIVEEARARQGELEIAKQHLADTTIVAPTAFYTDGSRRSYAVAGRLISIGEYVQEGRAVFRLVDNSLIKLRAQVPQRYASRVAVGQKVLASTESSLQDASGQVARINPQIDPANRTFEIEVSIPNLERVLKPGAFARAQILTEIQPRVVFVPQEALISFAGVNKVFTVQENKAQEIVVELGDRDGDWVEVTAGLSGDESVVVAGTSRLATGVAVQLTPPGPGNTPGSAGNTPGISSSGSTFEKVSGETSKGTSGGGGSHESA